MQDSNQNKPSVSKISTGSLKNINIKIGFSFFALISFIVISMLLLGGQAYKRILVQTEDNLIYSLTKVLGVSLNRVSFSGKYHSQFLIDQMLNDSDDLLYIIVQNENGNIIASSQKNDIPNEFVQERSKEAAKMFLEEQSTNTITSELSCCNNTQIKQLILPYFGSYDRDVMGKIVVGVSVTEIKNQLHLSTIILWTAGVVIILLTSIISLLISNYFTAPIDSMALKFQSILDYIPVSIIIRDRYGNIYDYSKEFINQFCESQQPLPAQTNIFHILHEKNELKTLDKQLVAGKRVITKEIRLRDNKKRNYYTVFNFLIEDPDRKKKSDLICTLAINIDDQKQVEEELRAVTQISQRAARAKANFLATMSHEMRTPLTSILGFLSLAQNLATIEKQKEFLDIAIKSGNNLLTLINDVLDFSQVESGNIKLNKKPFNLHEIIYELINNFKIQAKNKNIELTHDLSDEIAEHYIGDPNRIRQIILNITHNAIKFTDSGEVHLRTQIIKKYGDLHLIRISIKDSGIGMTTEQVSKIFDKFFQADTTSSRKYGGSGLGLSICKQLVNLMNGQIDVDSTPGSGTKFTIDLPLEVAKEVEIPQPAAIPAQIQPLIEPIQRKKRVLIVDDDESNRALLKFYLSDTDHIVDFAVDGIEAIKKYNENKYDIILMDIQMPNMDGIQATKEIRYIEHSEEKKSVPIVAFTANVLKEQLEAYNDVGFDGQLLKPFEKKDLLNIIEAA